MAAALNWTGITDSYGVPIGAYFLSTVDTMEALTEGGPPDVSVVDPGSWVKWGGAHALTTGLTHETVASWVQAQASCYIFLIAAVLWLLKFAMSSTWMSWLAIWFKPILEALRQLLVELHVFPICLALASASVPSTSSGTGAAATEQPSSCPPSPSACSACGSPATPWANSLVTTD